MQYMRELQGDRLQEIKHRICSRCRHVAANMYIYNILGLCRFWDAYLDSRPGSSEHWCHVLFTKFQEPENKGHFYKSFLINQEPEVWYYSHSKGWGVTKTEDFKEFKIKLLNVIKKILTALNRNVWTKLGYKIICSEKETIKHTT